MTIGIVEVACFATAVTAPPWATRTSTFRRMSSATMSGSRSTLPSANRASYTMFWPSM
jgi:hypothetical protein